MVDRAQLSRPVRSSSPSVADAPCSVARSWIRAFNARDLGAMLACVAEDVDFHPLRRSGARGPYRGRTGVREWFHGLDGPCRDGLIAVSETREVGDGRVFMSGSLTVDEESGAGPVCALYRIAGGLIVTAHHYLTEPELVAYLGLLR